jgi:hypothetical protein
LENLANILLMLTYMHLCIPRGILRNMWRLMFIARMCFVVYALILPIDWYASLHEAAPSVYTCVLHMAFLFLRRTYLLRRGSQFVREPSTSSSGSDCASCADCPPPLNPLQVRAHVVGVEAYHAEYYTGAESDLTRVPSSSSSHGSQSTDSTESDPGTGSRFP